MPTRWPARCAVSTAGFFGSSVPAPILLGKRLRGPRRPGLEGGLAGLEKFAEAQHAQADARLYGTERHAVALGDLAVAEPGKIRELDHGALVGGQLGNGVLHHAGASDIHYHALRAGSRIARSGSLAERLLKVHPPGFPGA